MSTSLVFLLKRRNEKERERGANKNEDNMIEEKEDREQVTLAMKALWVYIHECD